MEQDPLVYVPVDRWPELLEVFKSDWPRCISGYTLIVTQLRFLQQGHGYGFKVYCPFGDLKNGMVAFNKKDESYEIVIQCPMDDTNNLEEALRKTKLIDWKRSMILPFNPQHVLKVLKRITQDFNLQLVLYPGETFYLDRDAALYDDVRLPSGVTFGLLSEEHIELVNSTWPHAYPNSSLYFHLLIKTKNGYGIFKDGELVSWVFYNEAGNLGHLYTLKEHRRKGYAEMLLKLICNELLKEKRYVVAYCVKGNMSAHELYKKAGFRTSDDIAWAFVTNGKKSECD